MIAFALGLILAVINFFSDRFKLIRHRMKVVSFAAGIFISYLILHLLPYLYESHELRIPLLSLLLGFTMIHAIEKHIYTSKKKTEKIREEVKLTHSMTFFVYHLAIGMVLVNFMNRSINEGLLFFVPVLFFTAISAISLKEIHFLVRERGALKFILSVSTLIGVFISTYNAIQPVIYDIIIGFIIGTMLHVILMDAMPKEREGSPGFFILGVLLYTVLLVITWLI